MRLHSAKQMCGERPVGLLACCALDRVNCVRIDIEAINTLRSGSLLFERGILPRPPPTPTLVVNIAAMTLSSRSTGQATFIAYLFLSTFAIITERERDVVRFALDLVSCYVSSKVNLFGTKLNECPSDRMY